MIGYTRLSWKLSATELIQLFGYCIGHLFMINVLFLEGGDEHRCKCRRVHPTQMHMSRIHTILHQHPRLLQILGFHPSKVRQWELTSIQAGASIEHLPLYFVLCTMLLSYQ